MAAVTQRIGEIRDWVAALLCPNWRWMSLIAGSMFLFETIRVAEPSQAILGIASSLLAFLFFWVASRPEQPLWYAELWNRVPAPLKWPGWRGMLTMILLINSYYTILGHISDLFTGNYHTDAISYIHEDADLLLQGRNPFTADDAFWTACLRWPNASATPLLGSKLFGNNPADYPSFKKTIAAQTAEALNPALRSNNFDPGIVHNYPAGIIWLALPFIWAGLPSMIWLNLILFAVMVGIILARAPREERWPLGLALVAAPAFLDRGLFINFDVDCLVFALAAWNWLDKRVTSAILFGVACAVKQLAWFIAPFYLLEVARRYGWREALGRGGIAAAAFVLPNLPFIIASPRAWFHSVMIPLTDPNFPMGNGPIMLAAKGIIPFGSSHFWLALVVIVLGAFLLLQWKRPSITSDGLLLSLVPLWFSWRSPMNYFNLIPVFAAWIAVTHIMAQRTKAVEPPHHEALEEPSTEITLPEDLPPVASSEPQLAGVR